MWLARFGVCHAAKRSLVSAFLVYTHGGKIRNAWLIRRIQPNRPSIKITYLPLIRYHVCDANTIRPRPAAKKMLRHTRHLICRLRFLYKTDWPLPSMLSFTTCLVPSIPAAYQYFHPAWLTARLQSWATTSLPLICQTAIQVLKSRQPRKSNMRGFKNSMPPSTTKPRSGS
jgi:hypothetical protein